MEGKSCTENTEIERFFENCLSIDNVLVSGKMKTKMTILIENLITKLLQSCRRMRRKQSDFSKRTTFGLGHF